MYKRNVIYRPPLSDSEDDYDGFVFGDDVIKKPKTKYWHNYKDQELYEAALDGNLEVVKQQIEVNNFNPNAEVKGGFTILLHACKQGFLNIMEYLVVQKKADVNKQVDSVTPLMNVCDTICKDPDVIEKMAKLLLQHGAVVNVADKYGTTPFMLACKNGHTNIVRLIINDVSFDAIDNYGCTPIFHAVENNRADIVKILVDAGVDYKMANRKGYTPVQVAQFHGFYDLLELLPKEKDTYVVPSQFLAYNTLRDYIPRIFLKSECPEYFQEIGTILLSLGLEQFLEYFSKGRITLAQFLCMTDEQLNQLGIISPLYRMKIIKGLLDFHLHHWSAKSVARVSQNSQENFYEILMITANHLQHLIIINASIKFVKYHLRNDLMGIIETEYISKMQTNLKQYKDTLKELTTTTKYLSSFSPPKNPIYIDYDEYLAECKHSKFKCYFKYSLAIGLSVLICLKFKRIF